MPQLLQAQQLRAKLHEDSYDVAAYKQLLDELRSVPMSEEARKVYEELVMAFPTAVRATAKIIQQCQTNQCHHLHWSAACHTSGSICAVAPGLVPEQVMELDPFLPCQ